MGARPRAPTCTKIFQKYFKKQLTNCQKRDIISKLQNILDPLAQSVEHMTFNHGVRSSSLRWVTISERNHQRWFRSFIMLLTRPNFHKCEAFACFAHCCRVSAAILEAQSGVQSLRWVTTTQKTAPIGSLSQKGLQTNRLRNPNKKHYVPNLSHNYCNAANYVI